MALILNIETSSLVCSVCLSNDGKLIDFKEDRQGNSHARLLTVFIDELLKKNKISFAGLDAIAVSAGPGSYTGLRIGASSAKGLCYALNKPLIAVPTLFSLAEGIKQRTNYMPACYMPVMDARRMDIYTVVLDVNNNELFKTTAITVEKHLEEMIAPLGDIYIGGNAVDKCKQVFTSPQFHYVAGVDCDSRLMINLAELKYNQNAFEDTAYFQPLYLREFPAQNKK